MEDHPVLGFFAFILFLLTLLSIGFGVGYGTALGRGEEIGREFGKLDAIRDMVASEVFPNSDAKFCKDGDVKIPANVLIELYKKLPKTKENAENEMD